MIILVLLRPHFPLSFSPSLPLSSSPSNTLLPISFFLAPSASQSRFFLSKRQEEAVFPPTRLLCREILSFFLLFSFFSSVHSQDIVPDLLLCPRDSQDASDTAETRRPSLFLSLSLSFFLCFAQGARISVTKRNESFRLRNDARLKEETKRERGCIIAEAQSWCNLTDG